MIRDILILTLFPGAMAMAAFSDLFTMTVPNRIAIVLLGGFLVLAPMIGLDWSAIGWHLAVGLGALIVAFSFFAMGWIGGGDAKLFAATALWLGPAALLPYAVTATMLGGFLTLALLYVRKMPLPVGLASQDWVARLHAPRAGIPYGIALAAGGMIAYPHSPFMLALGG